MRRLLVLALLVVGLPILALPLLAQFAGPAMAVQPDEMLADPGLEARARDISQGLRCLVCRNESIDESNASLAHDLRVLVRERILAGDSDAEVVAFVVDRFGEFVLLQPTATGSNLLLWIAGPAMLAAALALAVGYVRRRQAAETAVASLTEQEARRVRDLLNG